jgi:hypothetical protein
VLAFPVGGRTPSPDTRGDLPRSVNLLNFGEPAEFTTVTRDTLTTKGRGGHRLRWFTQDYLSYRD